MRESKIEEAVCKYAKEQGCLVYKFTSPGRRSVPDRIFIHKGHVFFVEFKAPGKKPTKGQEREMERLREQGIKVYVCDDIEGGKFLIRKAIDRVVPYA